MTNHETERVVKAVTPEMRAAWSGWDPGFEKDELLQASLVRSAFMDGWLARQALTELGGNDG